MKTECFRGEMVDGSVRNFTYENSLDKGGLINFIFDIGAVIKRDTQ